MDTFCVENGHICFLIPHASEVRDGSRPIFPPFSSFFFSSPLISFQSCNKSVSVNVQSNKSKSFDECYLPGCSMTHQPPWKHSATSKCIAWRFTWHVFRKTDVFCGQLWRRLRRVKHANWPGRRRFAESLGSFVGTRGGLTSAESNMHSGQDDEDLQKALAFWLIAIRLGGRFQSGEARQSWSVNNPKRYTYSHFSAWPWKSRLTMPESCWYRLSLSVSRFWVEVLEPDFRP